MKKEKLNVHRFREHLFFIFVQLYINCSVLNVKILCKSAKTKEENEIILNSSEITVQVANEI